jgi:hypothetical protein
MLRSDQSFVNAGRLQTGPFQGTHVPPLDGRHSRTKRESIAFAGDQRLNFRFRGNDGKRAAGWALFHFQRNLISGKGGHGASTLADFLRNEVSGFPFYFGAKPFAATWMTAIAV